MNVISCEPLVFAIFYAFALCLNFNNFLIKGETGYAELKGNDVRQRHTAICSMALITFSP